MKGSPKLIASIIGIVLFSSIYFGLDTKPSKQRALEKSRAANLEATGIQNIVSRAKDSLSNDELAFLDALNTEVKSAESDSAKIIKLKQLSSAWYEAGFPILSGYYAEEIAKLQSEEHDPWAVAGTTYILGMRRAEFKDERQYARDRAITALESAVSIEPENVSDQINLALIYVEAPDTNPMQGILMLRDLNEKYPDNVRVMNQLGRLAIQTNQTEKALQRLTKSFEIDPQNKNTTCLLAKAYEQAGDAAKAAEFEDKCNNIIQKQ